MTRRLTAVALAAALVLTAGACSKKEENTTTGATTAPTTAASSGTTEQKSTDTTEKRSTGTTEKKSTGTTSKSGSGAMRKPKNVELTSSEEACAEEAFTQYVAQNPLAEDAELAGALGGAIAACVPKAKVADAIVNAIASGGDFTSTQTSCMRDNIISLDTTDLGALIGLALYSDSDSATNLESNLFQQAIGEQITQGCNIS